MFQHVEQPGYQTILTSPLDGPAADQEGDVTPVAAGCTGGAPTSFRSTLTSLSSGCRGASRSVTVPCRSRWPGRHSGRSRQILDDINGPLAGVDLEIEEQARQTADAGGRMAVNITAQSGESATDLLLEHLTRLEALRDRLEEIAGAATSAGGGRQPRRRHRKPRGDRRSSGRAAAGAIRRRD